jgi:hypothetical protein
MLSSRQFIYKGANLPCTGINKWDSAEVAFQKLDNAICAIISQMYNIQMQIYQLIPQTPTTTTTTTTISS